MPSAMPCHAKFNVKFCHSSVSSNVTVAFFPLLLDINECTTNAHNCDANAVCNNTEGSYNCTCSPGYTGNGTSCTGIYIILTLICSRSCKCLRKRSEWNSSFCFPESPEVPRDEVEGNIRTQGKTKLTGFPRNLTLSVLLYFWTFTSTATKE